MKRKGFTLAEVLIALAIIGVVAVLTIPTLVSGYKKEVWANSLAVAVSNFETAMHGMINKDGVYDLYETKAWTNIDKLDMTSDDAKINNFVSFLGDSFSISYDKKAKTIDSIYQGANKMRDIKNEIMLDLSGQDYYFVPLKLKQGTIYFLHIADSKKSDDSLTEEKLIEENVGLSSIAAEVIIDINGTGKPNTIGKDIFWFALSPEGKLYPKGGKDYAYIKSGNTLTWKDSSSPYACTDSAKGDYGWGCTARLVENGYKMDY